MWFGTVMADLIHHTLRMKQTLIFCLLLLFNLDVFGSSPDGSDSTKKELGTFIKLIDIEVEIDNPTREISDTQRNKLELAQCPNVYISDSIIHVHRRDFDTASKTVVYIHYHNTRGFSDRSTYVAFLKEHDTLPVYLAMNKSAIFYRIVEKKGTRILSPKNKKTPVNPPIKTSYSVQKKDNPYVLYTIEESHKINVIERMPYKVEEDFGCE